MANPVATDPPNVEDHRVDWTQPYFDGPYLARWQLGLPTEADMAEASATFDQLGCRTGGRLADAGCGQGRFSIAFARLGCVVMGFDSSAVLLEEARRLAEADGQDVS